MTGDPSAAPVGPELPPELAQQFHVDSAGTVWLRAGRCAETVVFPPRRYCGDDMSDPEEVLLPGAGRVNCVTRVRVRPPYDLPQGYMIGFVDLDAAPVRVFGLFAPQDAGAMVPGRAVALTLQPFGTDNEGTPCLRPVFVAA
ncbi:Zn-ribbon domain-containing OB-fold protein [Antarcticimicrobium sediminis]|uniref:DUF35 domain-containing protein n=1 Tax=Antarcticimicrobium sediminis TaxID=2546227 RepID=A0A4R5ENX6_9RHOB|nr:hypothetical protein [Antarcticimicrobium sediminis]TDE36307.1 hypothetical protein E1B25_15465 [Antarcticimicrobium sediminis]